MIYLLLMLICYCQFNFLIGAHLLIKQLQSYRLECICCQSKYDLGSDLVKHHQQLHKETIYKCQSCGPQYELAQKRTNELFNEFVSDKQMNRLKRKLADANLKPKTATADQGKRSLYNSPTVGHNIQPDSLVDNEKKGDFNNTRNNGLIPIDYNSKPVSGTEEDNNEMLKRVLICKFCQMESGEINLLAETADNFASFICSACSNLFNIEDTQQKIGDDYLWKIGASDSPANLIEKRTALDSDLRICILCNFTGNDNEIIQHTYAAHNKAITNPTGSTCQICQTSLEGDDYQKLNHIIEHHRRGSFKCPYCAELYNNPNAIIEHATQIHQQQITKNSDFLLTAYLYEQVFEFTVLNLRLGLQHKDLQAISIFFDEMPLFVCEGRGKENVSLSDQQHVSMGS